MLPKKKVVPKLIIINLLKHFTLNNKVKEDQIIKEEIAEYPYNDLEHVLDIVLTYSNINVFTLKVGELKKIKEFNPYWRRPIK